MRIIKIVLLALLVLTGCLFGYDRIRQSVTGAGEGPAIQCDSDILEISVRQPQSDLLGELAGSDLRDAVPWHLAQVVEETKVHEFHDNDLVFSFVLCVLNKCEDNNGDSIYLFIYLQKHRIS